MRITITVPDEVYERAKLVAEVSGLPVSEVIANAAAVSLPEPLSGAEQAVSNLSDEDVVALANSMMPRRMSARLTELLDGQQRRTLSVAERTELDGLMQQYYIGQLKKAEGLVEAVTRGLMPSPRP